ncbi:MAG: class I SAM-dependent methyltransferase [Ruminococcus flavefaciens]|nr:class I SAM-dependent methyltransferase [Ruminococcus flavefaciens]
MNSKEYKNMTIQEFTKAADKYEGDKSGIYAMCKKDYPDILAELKKEKWDTLLDAGCGPAPMITLLSKKYPDRHYTGLDLTPKMIETAKKKKIPNTEFIVGDCENLPFKANTFDVIICSNSFHHYPNPQKFFNSVYKCLKKGGRLILRDYTANALVLWFFNHIEMPIVNLIGHGDVAMVSEKDIRKMARKAHLNVELFERRKGMRMHCVLRK